MASRPAERGSSATIQAAGGGISYINDCWLDFPGNPLYLDSLTEFTSRLLIAPTDTGGSGVESIIESSPLLYRLYDLFGIDFFEDVLAVKLTGRVTADIRRLPQLVQVEIVDGESDAGLEHLQGLPRLRILVLDGDGLSAGRRPKPWQTQPAASAVAGDERQRHCRLGRPRGIDRSGELEISGKNSGQAQNNDMGLPAISKLTQLHRLKMTANCTISDAGLAYLEKLAASRSWN